MFFVFRKIFFRLVFETNSVLNKDVKLESWIYSNEYVFVYNYTHSFIWIMKIIICFTNNQSPGWTQLLADSLEFSIINLFNMYYTIIPGVFVAKSVSALAHCNGPEVSHLCCQYEFKPSSCKPLSDHKWDGRSANWGSFWVTPGQCPVSSHPNTDCRRICEIVWRTA